MPNNYLPVGDMAMLGAGAGGILGGLYAPKGKTMRRILGGAAVGGLGGAGMAAGNNLTSGMFEGMGSSEPTIPNVVLPKLVGLGGAYTGLHLGNKAYREFEEDLEGKKKDKPKKEKAMKEKEKTAAYKFGSNILPGAGLGALAGGLYGLAAPGEEEEYDETGRLVDRKPRSRINAALRGALGGGLLGGAGGVVADHYAPNASSNAYDFARGLFTGKSKSELTRGDNVAKLTPAGQSVDRQARTIGQRNNPNATRALTMRNGVNPYRPPAKNETRPVSIGPNGFEIDNAPDIELPAAQ